MQKKFLLAPAILLSFSLAACAPSSSTDQQNASSGAAMTDRSPSNVITASGAMMGSGAAMHDGATASGAAMQAMRTIDVTVKNFAFTPNTIKIKKGESVSIRLIGTEGTHGFAVPDLGVNVSVSAGQKVVVAIPTGKAGTFKFFCSILCGPGHSGMTGTIIIE